MLRGSKWGSVFFAVGGQKHILNRSSGGFDILVLRMNIAILKRRQISIAANGLERLHGDLRPLREGHVGMTKLVEAENEQARPAMKSQGVNRE